MTVTRRTFLRSGSLSALGTVLLLRNFKQALGQKLKSSGSKLDFPIPYEAKLDPVFNYNTATFEPYIGGFFSARGQGKNATLVLQSVETLKPGSTTRLMPVAARPTSCFALLFSADAPLAEFTTIHTIHHGALGKFDLFLTQLTDEQGHLFYEAIINHLVA
jgi:hypothetical protein